jgi:hypothetical protein
MPYLDLITGALGFLFTVLIFSYLLGDNPLFRIGTYIFVGVAAGYVAAVAMWQVIYPRLLYPLAYGTILEKALLGIPFLLAGLLLMKAWPRLSFLGTPSVAYLAGVSAAVTVGGAVIGTLFPQTFAAMDAYNLERYSSPLEGLWSGTFILVGTVSTLAYFHFGARSLPDGSIRRLGILEGLAWVGRIFIAITLGVLFAGVFLASLTAFVERLTSWSDFFSSF